MKKALIATTLTLGALASAACGGEDRPAQDPSTVTTSVTTETTATPNRNASASATNGASTGATSPVTSPAPTTPAKDGRDATYPNGSDATTGSAMGAAGATPPSQDNPGVANGTKDADNTKINDRDRHGTVTPGNQGGGNDRDITAAIRRAVVADKNLSFNAKNVKIITTGGKVTLRGPVKSDEEKSNIEAKAKATAGVADVDNQLEVKK